VSGVLEHGLGRIIWNKNPLASRIELTFAGRQLLRSAVELEDCKEALYGAYFHLDENRHADSLHDMKRWVVRRDEKVEYEKFLDERSAYYERELVGHHDGDCTCQPCTCGKCLAEGLLGVFTIDGLGTHEAATIGAAFGKDNERSADYVIDYLKRYDPKPAGSWLNYLESWNANLPRFRQEATRALEWLIGYYDAHPETKAGGVP
jgi:hypothetical protein